MAGKSVVNCDFFLHGGDYNPEQWLDYPEVLKQDIEYMKKAHVNAMSIGIFSWAALEPEEGKFDFSFLDDVIDKLSEAGIKIVLATPSGARPRWLAEKYPEVLRVDKDNRKHLYHDRHNHCYTSPVYREKVQEIDRRIAERYKGNKNIILWHISNELGGECHCELCQQAFREFLKKKYDGDLKKLNHAWWAGFWSHSVTSWEQIHSPVTVGEQDKTMTGLYLDWKEFITFQTTDFMRHEINTVKAITPDIPVTTNFMGPYQHLDYHYMKDFVDVISWDSYPEWHSARGNIIEGYSIAFAHDLHRCFKNKPFLLMESTPSLVNWAPICKLKKPGMHKLSSLQAVAHGSDSVQYFQWRKGRGGAEKFHGAVIDHNGKASGRVFDDVKNLGITLEKISEIAGSNVRSKAAVVYEFKNRWALDNASGLSNIDKKYKRTVINHYKEFWKRGINVDVIGIDSDFSPYSLLVLPMLYLVTEKQAQKIKAFVNAGGTVIATYTLGYVNESDLCYLGGFPGAGLSEVFGLFADEIDSLYETDSNAVRYKDKSYKAVDYCELITPNGANTIGEYEEDFYRGMPAVLENSYGKGKTYYIAFRDEGEFLNDFYEDILKELNMDSLELPEGTSVRTREDEKYLYTFAQNYADKPLKITLKNNVYTDMENGEETNGEFLLEPYGIKVLKSLK